MDCFVASLLAMTVKLSDGLDHQRRRDLLQLKILAVASAVDHQEIALQMQRHERMVPDATAQVDPLR